MRALDPTCNSSIKSELGYSEWSLNRLASLWPRKKETPGNETLQSNSYHEYMLHCDVSAAFEQYQSISSEVHVPKPFKFISWEENDAF
ncbi:hypothetical protein N7447_009679 [Penicillium robsamsonii]|uniref:uncharacterized protein n=1 Tax=Penicillium robsamsonii TaxID=1792511 RepID=UPI002547D535|nr:uncharacterized protein N7447_009679 [Penicillium robsamsonii]KAJ5817446.1 hypothetical protein N7447_009679 [Penicillium robsamsonii]